VRSHKLTNVAVLACVMLLAGASTAVLGLAMRFSVVSLTLISVCLMAAAGLAAALVLYRRGLMADDSEMIADSEMEHRLSAKETSAL
jgi:hypothetical protein